MIGYVRTGLIDCLFCLFVVVILHVYKRTNKQQKQTIYICIYICIPHMGYRTPLPNSPRVVAVQSALKCPPALRTTSAAVRRHVLPARFPQPLRWQARSRTRVHDFLNHYVGKHARACVCAIWGGYTERGMVIVCVSARGAVRTLAEGLKLTFVGEEEQKTGGSIVLYDVHTTEPCCLQA